MMRFKSKILQNFSGVTVFNILSQVVGVFTSVKLTGYLGVREYGLYSLLIVQVTIFAILANFGLRQVIIRHIARNISKESVKAALHSSLWIKMLMLILTVITIFVYNYSFDDGNYSFSSLLILAYLVLLQSLTDSIDSVAFGLERMWPTSLIGFLLALVWLAFLFGGHLDWFTFEGILYAYTVIRSLHLFIYFVWFYGVYRRLPTDIERNRVISVKYLFVEGFPFFALAVFTAVQNQFPVLFLQIRSTAEEISFFNLGYRLVSPLQMLLFTLMMAMYPMFCRLAEDNLELFFRRVKGLISFLVVIGIYLAFLFSMFSSEIVLFLYGEVFYKASKVIELQVWALLFLVVFSVFGTVLSAFNQQSRLSRLSLVYALLSVPISYYFAKQGAEGLAFGFIVAAIINFSYHIYYFIKWTNRGISTTYLLKIYGLLTISALLVPRITRYFNVELIVKCVICGVFAMGVIFYIKNWYTSFIRQT